MDVQFASTLMLCMAIVLMLFLILTVCVIFHRELGEIKGLLYERYVKFDPKVDELVGLAVDHWRLNKNFGKIKSKLSPEDTKKIESSIYRIQNYLRDNDIEVSDYTGRSANDGINVDVVSREFDSTREKPIIKDTIVPTVTYKGNMRKKAQVIILDNSQSKEEK